MTTTSFNISGKLDAHVVEVMAQLSAACSSLGADFLLVGAVARDIHFLHVHGRAPVRATADVDFAVLVPSWGFSSMVGWSISGVISESYQRCQQTPSP